MGVIEVKYFNSFILRKTLSDSAPDSAPMWNGSRGNNTYGNTAIIPTPAVSSAFNWAVEEARITGGYNLLFFVNFFFNRRSRVLPCKV